MQLATHPAVLVNKNITKKIEELKECTKKLG
jgi:hypothetical protein